MTAPALACLGSGGAGNRPLAALSYGVPYPWASAATGSGILNITSTFLTGRGTSNCIGAAECTTGNGQTKQASGTNVVFIDGITAPTSATTWNATLTTNGGGYASEFTAAGCNVVMMDGSVRVVAGNLAPPPTVTFGVGPVIVPNDFVKACTPSNPTPFTSEW